MAVGDGRLGPLIDRWTLGLPAARAVKNRRTVVAEAIRQVAADWPGTESVPVTSLAAGPACELFDVLTASDALNVLATCVDIDHEALAFTPGIATPLGRSASRVVRPISVRHHTGTTPVESAGVDLFAFRRKPSPVR
jgi:hypothetical protein